MLRREVPTHRGGGHDAGFAGRRLLAAGCWLTVLAGPGTGLRGGVATADYDEKLLEEGCSCLASSTKLAEVVALARF